MKLSFEEWKRMLNAWLYGQSGMDSEDLPDCPYRDWYDQDVTYKNAARRALKQAKDY